SSAISPRVRVDVLTSRRHNRGYEDQTPKGKGGYSSDNPTSAALVVARGQASGVARRYHGTGASARGGQKPACEEGRSAMKNTHRGMGTVFQPTYTDAKTGELKTAATWRIQFFVGGKCYRESAGTTDRKIAVKLLK